MKIKMKRRRREPALPILGYYLTFIHYFGFSINQNISRLNSPHNLSKTGRSTTDSIKITTKKAKILNLSTNSPKSAIINNNTKTSIKTEGYGNDSRWFLSNKLHDKKQQGKQPLPSSFKEIIALALKKGVKFIAISFTTFLALNHCIVLVDYIYQGTMRFEELMFDFRLVITKISALIFVLSWHFNQTKVDKLIKLVKSTSIYTLTTENADQLSERSVGERVRGRTLSGGNLASSTKLSSNEQHLLGPPSSWARGQDGERSFNEAFMKLARAKFKAITKFNCSDKREAEEAKVEGDKEINLFTAKVNKRILKWWIMCIFVTVVHFSLSEAEIFKSHHLWTWLDDYSMHQLSNRTTSLTTLMFLASFDNYIYTVHVYGARLIGASIICIVCSLQRENIDFLRYQSLQMLKVSSLYESSHRLDTTKENNNRDRTSKKVVDNLMSRQTLLPLDENQKRERSIIALKRIKLAALSSSGICENTTSSSKGGANFIPLLHMNDNNKHIDVSFVQRIKNDNEIRESNNNIDNKVCETNYELDNGNTNKNKNNNNNNNNRNLIDHDDDEVSHPNDRDLFFVLGESDWLKLQDNLIRLRPCGYLSSPLYDARKCLYSKYTELITSLMNMKKLKKLNVFEKLSKNRISCSRDLMIMASNLSINEEVNSAVACDQHHYQQDQPKPCLDLKLPRQQRQKACCRLTPTPTCLHSDVLAAKPDQAKPPNQINAPQLESSLMKGKSAYDELASFQTTPNGAKIIKKHDHLHHFRITNDLFQQADESIKTKATTATAIAAPTTNTTVTSNNHYPLFTKVDDKTDYENLFSIRNEQQRQRQRQPQPQQNNYQALNEDNRPLGTTPAATTTTRSGKKTIKASNSQEQPFMTPVNTSEMIEWQLERLASKYELVRTVNSRIDSCFGPMLLIQYSFLFLMSCIDVVYFSICFNPNTKTKYIIISGMILLWWPYLLLYEFASDIGTSSKELLISVRRLARLSLVEHNQSMLLLSKEQQQHQLMCNKKCQANEALGGVTRSPLTIMTQCHHPPYTHPSSISVNSKTASNFRLATLNSLLDYNLNRRELRFQLESYKQNGNNNHYNETTRRLSNLDKNTYCLRNRSNLGNSSALTSDNETSNCHSYSSPALLGKTRARIINKLDHVFKPTNLSIIGIMTIDKFFLLNFAKIVITASVMVIQFISY